MAAEPFLLNITVLLASLFLLFKAADLIVYGISDYARRLGLSDYIIGLIVVAFSLSAPELISSLFGFMLGKTELFLGIILGANMVHFALSIGLLLVVGKKLRFDNPILGKQKLFAWLLLMLPFLLMIDGELSRFNGAILLAAFFVYLGVLWIQEGRLGKLKKRIALRTIWRDAIIFLGSLVALLLAGRWLVFSTINLSAITGITPYLLSVTIMGIATTIPDFVVQLRSIIKGHTDIGIGDAIGSAIIELVLFFGLVALIKPFKIAFAEIGTTLLFLALSISTIFLLTNKKEGTWKHGILLIALYVLFVLIELAKIQVL
ncbi:MAG: hypothetical protein QXU88_02840 [Candidatus Woesearchaeota archaeon]